LKYYKKLKKNLKSKAGCGAGFHLRFVASIKPTDCLYVASDISAKMLEAASFRL